MFNRILVEEWQRVLTIISFSVFFSVFILTVLRALRMPRRQLEHLETLPLQTEPAHESKATR